MSKNVKHIQVRNVVIKWLGLIRFVWRRPRRNRSSAKVLAGAVVVVVGLALEDAAKAKVRARGALAFRRPWRWKDANCSTVLPGPSCLVDELGVRRRRFPTKVVPVELRANRVICSKGVPTGRRQDIGRWAVTFVP